ncbi:MAG: hypothetical protein QM628_04995 [Propionicimonas sp.]
MGRSNEHDLGRVSADLDQAAANLTAAIDFLSNPDQLYRRLRGHHADEKHLHTAVFERIYIHQDLDTDITTEAQLHTDLQLLKDLEHEASPTAAHNAPEPADPATNPNPEPNPPHAATSRRQGAKTPKAAPRGGLAPTRTPGVQPLRGSSKRHMAEDTRFELVRA